MAELNTIDHPAGACCAPDTQRGCCEPSDKAGCCGPQHESGRCGCPAAMSSEDGEARQDLLAQPKQRARPLAEPAENETDVPRHVRHMSRDIT
jgi:hypothetical protein